MAESTSLSTDPEDLTRLIKSFCSRFNHTGDLTDITNAIAAGRKAVEVNSEGQADLSDTLNDLGNVLWSHFTRTGDLSDVDEAIAAYQRAAKLLPDGHGSDLSRIFHNLGIAYHSRFHRTSKLEDITEAVTAYQMSCELTPSNHETLASRLNNYGNSLWTRFGRTGNLPDITEAVTTYNKAIELTPDNDPGLPSRLNNIGNAFWSRFVRTGDLSDIDEAIKAYQKAADLTPPDHDDLTGLLNNIAISFGSRYDLTSDLSDLGEAIASGQKVVKLTSPDHESLPSWLNNLGISLRSRFVRTGDLLDIAEAIEVGQKAVELTPIGHADLPSWISNLGSSYLSRFTSTSSIDDVDEAINAYQKAVNLCPAGHAKLPGFLNNLGSSFSSHFNRKGDPADIDHAIETFQRGIELTPPGHTTIPPSLSNLARALRFRFSLTGDLDSISQAISKSQRALELTPSGHVNRPSFLQHHGSLYHSRFDKTRSRDDLDKSKMNYQDAATSAAGSPSGKLTAARNWARLSLQYYSDSEDTVSAYDTVIRLMSMVAGLEQTVQHRHRQLRDISEASLEAAAAACTIGRPDKAVEWLEQGRCLVWSQLNQLRSPLEELALRDKDLADRVSKVSRELERSGSRDGAETIGIKRPIKKASAEDEALSHIRLAKEWDNLLSTVRKLPGFEHFLQPPPCSTILQHLPKVGPVIIINVYTRRCDAIALRAGLDPLHIPLPEFTYTKAKKYCTKMNTHLESVRSALSAATEESQSEENKDVTGDRAGSLWFPPSERPEAVLASLWREVVKPIFEALKISPSQTGDTQTRVWWCPTGPLTFLPLHAAGIYVSKKTPESAFDYAVSSYTPNITALTDRVKKNDEIDNDKRGLFLVSQPNAPGLSFIPGTTAEVGYIQQQANEHAVRVLLLEGPAATGAKGLENMENYSSIHFACHATQDPNEPLNSGFFFHDGRLELAKITQINLKNADLAFLSACQTSSGNEELSEEAVHLAAGMLAAGYRGVVATMWSIGDREAPDVAKDFYQYLWTQRSLVDGVRMSESHDAAYALHHAVQQLRKKTSFHIWVPYVHYGL